MTLVDAALVVLTVASLCLHVVMVSQLVLRARRRTSCRPIERVSRVSILKPLAGADDALAENLESFARLEGAPFELVLGVASRLDPAHDVACAFVRRHPGLAARVVLTHPHGALNPKVAQLIDLERACQGDVLVISDSNVAVRPDYLATLLGELGRPGVGLVSSVVAGVGERTLGAALENLILAAHVAPGVLASARFTRVPISVGKSMAMRRSELAALGGFERVANVLAEDHALAQLFDRAGYRVAVDLVPVENRNTTCTLARSLERHTRWAKIRRAMAPAAFTFEPVLLPMVPAAAAFAASPRTLTGAIFVASAFAQALGAELCLRALRGHGLGWRALPVEGLRTLLMLTCWAGAWASRRVCWRGHELRVLAGTVLEIAPPRAWSRWLAAARAALATKASTNRHPA